MTKTDLPYITASDLRPAGDPSPAIDDFQKLYGRRVVSFFVILVTSSKNYLEDLK